MKLDDVAKPTQHVAVCVQSLFELEAQANPDRIAVVFGAEDITYGELNRRANGLAHELRSLGIGHETLVGVLMKRSTNLIVSLLAILKAGAAYLPLDPGCPAERIAVMLEDATPPLILTEAALLGVLPTTTAQLVCVDNLEIAEQNFPNPPCTTTAGSLAYVMYTSGSTGLPNGVMIEHRSIVRLVKDTDYANFSADNVFLQFAPITFDASTFEIWGALLNGAQLAIMPEGNPSLAELGAAIRKYGVTTLWLTAGLFHLMVDERLEDLRPLRQLLAGGDVLSVPHVQKVLNTLNCELINGYGPTENTTFTCCYTIPRDTPIGTSVPIGRPIAKTQVYILDENRKPVPVGEPGEIYIGGEGLARGYLNRSDMTAARFLSSGDVCCARLYRSGDRGRARPDGVIEFLGRVDNQVKIRGFRIELEEIELALAGYAGVREAIVVPRETSAAEKQLIAFITTDPETNVEVCALRRYLEAKLPDYMLPSFIFSRDEMPLNQNGKVDRRALLQTIPTASDRPAGFVQPATETEAKVAAIIQDVLQVEKVGAESNFFDLGATSLQLLRAHDRLQGVFTSEIKIIALFQHPTVKSLAEFLREKEANPRLSNASRVRGLQQRQAFDRFKRMHGGLHE